MPSMRAAGSSRPDRALIHAGLVIGAGVLATTLAQTGVLAHLPLQNLLKNELHESRTASAAFFFWASLAWYLKPLAGIVTDAFPLLGSRRRSYILLSASGAALAWFALAATPHEYHAFLRVAIIINIFMVIASTVVGGFLVETAHAVAGSGRLTAIRQVVMQSCGIVNGPIAGYLAGIAFGWTAGACGAVMLLLVPVAFVFLKEPRREIDTATMLAGARGQLAAIARARTMWAAVGLMALFYIAPGFGTALFYRQQNELHFTTHDQGMLQLIGGCTGVCGAVAYGWLCRRLSLRLLLAGGLTLGAALTLMYMSYTSWWHAAVIDGINGFGGIFAELALMDLAVRATPVGSEGLGYSLMLSIRNLALAGTDWFGSRLMDQSHVAFNTLVIANAATTLLAVPLIFLLPRAIVGARDAEGYGAAVGSVFYDPADDLASTGAKWDAEE